MGSDREQELARTATAPGSGTAAAPAPVGATLGRYRLERELGAGAMGVVHAAFDPDLERRIALKVLRNASATSEAKDRLMREARAMARLTHPNVVTVHEVGTAGGRDFVAMELIQGETLAEWLRAARRPPAAIIDAFVAAGRGLAAAHAAGIVHRDFKPHNVLRSRDGRIVVTDFGLAREAQAAPAPALDATLPFGSEVSTPSALAGLTVTGALLGTPAYMAPEQWRGGAITPATDQFAFCVALWEALSGERPYRGPTLDDLRSQVARGPAALDASRIPRRVRGILRRGLDPEPARRWSSMEALIAQLVRAQRRPGIAIAIAGGALIVAGALVFAFRPREAPAAACEPPARDVAAVWSAAIRADMAARTSDAHVAALDTAYWTWRAARGAACRAAPQIRPAQLQCLDGVLGRFDALRRAFARAPGAAAEELQAQLIDPEICSKPAGVDVPRLTLAPTPEVTAAYALLARATTEARPSDREIAAVTDAAADPCARVIATLAFDESSRNEPRKRAQLGRAIGTADQCGDDRLRADLLIRLASHQRNLPVTTKEGEALVRQAEVAAHRVMQTDLGAAVSALHRIAARERGQWDEVFRLYEIEIAGYGARGLPVRQLRAVIACNDARIARSGPADLEAVAADVRAWRPIAAARHRPDLVWRLDFIAAHARLRGGDLASAHADLVRLWQARPPSDRPDSGHAIEGDVVDSGGRPVPGATVAAALRLFSDSIGIGLPIEADDSLRITTTDAAGHFVLRDAPATGPIAAQLGDRRSRPVEIADRVKLVLEPTRSVSGRIDLGGVPYTRVSVVSYPIEKISLLSSTMAPVAADGSFAISGVSRGAVFVAAVVADEHARGEGGNYRQLPASSGSVADLRLALTSSSRALDVVVRSTVAVAIDAGAVWVLPGSWQIKSFGDLLRSPVLGGRELHPQPVGDNTPAALAGKLRRDDLFQHVEHVAPGELTVCAAGFPGDLTEPGAEERLMAHLSDLAIRCEHVGPDGRLVVISVPPQQRFDER